MTASPTAQRILALSATVHSVAIYHRGTRGPGNTGCPESGTYGGLLVDPTLQALVRQRGTIDCDSFFGFVAPVEQEHVPAGLEPSADPLPLVPRILELVSALLPAACGT
ncbi:MAG TPA: hypothetical protein VGR60_00695 [Gemmatimonadales bacterium]|nr:hypothetical protein [Gemmatimonadales bacterium]